MTVWLSMLSFPPLLVSHESATNLIDEECAEIRQACHVSECKDCIPPRPSFPFDRGKRRSTLGAQGKENHDRECDYWGIDWTAIRPALSLHDFSQLHAFFVLFTPKIVDCS